MDVPVLSDLFRVTDIAWVVIAFLAGWAAQTRNLPPLVGYLAAGMGLSVLGAEGSPVVDRIGEIGVAVLLFLVGLDVRWKSVKKPAVVGAGSLHIALFAGLAAAGGWALGLPVAAAAAIGVALCTSSLVLAARALDERGSRQATSGQVTIGIILVQHVAATAAAAGVGAAVPSPWALGLLALPAARPVLMRVLDRVGRGELLLLFGLAVTAGGSILFAEVRLGPELGALAAGILLAGHDRTDELRDSLVPVKNALLPAFFLSVGLVGLPDATGLAVVAGLLVALGVKAGMLYGLLGLFGLDGRTAWHTTLPLTTYSGLTLIVGNAAVQAGSLPASALTVLAVATAVSYVLNAPLARHADALWRRAGPVLRPLTRSARHAPPSASVAAPARTPSPNANPPTAEPPTAEPPTAGSPPGPSTAEPPDPAGADGREPDVNVPDTHNPDTDDPDTDDPDTDVRDECRRRTGPSDPTGRTSGNGGQDFEEGPEGALQEARYLEARYLVVGMGRTGTAAYDYLDDSLRCPAGLDRDAERVSTHRRQGRRVLHGDPCDPSLWTRIDVRRADGVLLAGSDLGRQLETIRVLRASGYREAIYALTARPENRDVLHDAGANTVYLSIDRAGRALAAHGLKHAKDGAPRTVTLSVGVDQVETDETPRRRTAPSK